MVVKVKCPYCDNSFSFNSEDVKKEQETYYGEGDSGLEYYSIECPNCQKIVRMQPPKEKQ